MGRIGYLELSVPAHHSTGREDSNQDYSTGAGVLSGSKERQNRHPFVASSGIDWLDPKINIDEHEVSPGDIDLFELVTWAQVASDLPAKEGLR